MTERTADHAGHAAAVGPVTPGREMAPPAWRTAWPPGRFYWAVIDAPGARRGPAAPGVLASFEDELPLPIDEVHAVVEPLPGGRALVCAAPRKALDALPEGALSLVPEALPTELTDDLGTASARESGNAPSRPGVDEPGIASRIELLAGAHEPRPIRRARAGALAAVSLACAMLPALGALGLERRAAHWRAEALHASAATDAMLRAADTRGELALAAELRRLRAQAAAPPTTPPRDGAATLAAWLASWPTGVPVSVHHVSIAGDSMWLSASVPGDPAPLLESLRAPEGWRLDEPTVQAVPGSTRLTLKLHAQGAMP